MKDTLNPGDGINCQTCVHLFYQHELGIFLPLGLWSAELWQDRHFFRKVDGQEELYLGDIFFFGKTRDTNPRDLHLAVFTGHFWNRQSLDPFLLHATNLVNGIVTWPLSRFSQETRYQALFGVKRLKNEYLTF